MNVLCRASTFLSSSRRAKSRSVTIFDLSQRYKISMFTHPRLSNTGHTESHREKNHALDRNAPPYIRPYTSPCHTNGHTHGHLWSSLRSFMFVLLIPCLFLAGISRQETPQPKVAAMDESVADTVGAIGSLHKLPWLDSTHLTLTLRMCA